MNSFISYQLETLKTLELTKFEFLNDLLKENRTNLTYFENLKKLSPI